MTLKAYVTYSLEIAKEICDTIAESSDGLRKLCEKNKHRWPTYQAIRGWRSSHKEFGEWYRQAKWDQADFLVDEIMQISDDNTQDYLPADEHGNCRVNAEHIQRARLRVDSRKWVAAKLAPKLYGDKLHTEHSGSLGLHEKSLLEIDKNEG